MCAEECWLCLSASRLYASIHVERGAFLFFVLVLGVRKDFQIALFNLGEKVDEGEEHFKVQNTWVKTWMCMHYTTSYNLFNTTLQMCVRFSASQKRF